MLLGGKIATGSIESDLFANLVAIVNEVNSHSVMQPKLSVTTYHIEKFITDDNHI